MRANHNRYCIFVTLTYAVMYGTKLQKWEQITTFRRLAKAGLSLWCMVQSYKNESKSQRRTWASHRHIRCDVWYKVTKMRANHNRRAYTWLCFKAVMYGTKLQKWEQITTNSSAYYFLLLLWCMVQSYKNESKSQLLHLFICHFSSCDVWYKVTKMRANHNIYALTLIGAWAVMYGTKLQKWEQITTTAPFSTRSSALWCMVQSYKNESKSQLNHLHRCWVPLWCMVQSYKNESKSQLKKPHQHDVGRCDVWYKVTKMRANHNFARVGNQRHGAVMYGTKLQKWEQITTENLTLNMFPLLWCMVQSYKNESKSQQNCISVLLNEAVMYGTKLQKWEQITTLLPEGGSGRGLWCMVQSYKNESKSQL